MTSCVGNVGNVGQWPPAILDIEASGFGPRGYPIEIGIILPNGRAWCSLIRPQPEWIFWDEEAEALHGITRTQLLQIGRPAKEVTTILNEWLEDHRVYSDGWAHDYPWLHRLYDAADAHPSFTLDSIRSLLTEAQAASWASMRHRTAQTLLADRHRASQDARVVQKTLSMLATPVIGPAPQLRYGPRPLPGDRRRLDADEV